MRQTFHSLQRMWTVFCPFSMLWTLLETSGISTLSAHLPIMDLWVGHTANRPG